MAEWIESPPRPTGDEKNQLKQMWSYLGTLSQAVSSNLEGIGSNELTDEEQMVMNLILQSGDEQGLNEPETLKGMIVKTAEYLLRGLNYCRTSLLGEMVKNGVFGNYTRDTEIDVEVTPSGDTLATALDEAVQQLERYRVNTRNYIMSGQLRTSGGNPVYGIAAGKNVVTFNEYGEETYNDENKVLELTEDGAKVCFPGTGNEVSITEPTSGSIEIGSTAKLLIKAGIGMMTTTVTNLNSLTTPGTYSINMSYASNRPSGLTSGYAEIEVTRSDSFIHQKIYTEGAIHTRRYSISGGSWGSWYKFTGTAV